MSPLIVGVWSFHSPTNHVTSHSGDLVISFANKSCSLSQWGFGYFIYQEMAPFIVGVWLFHLPRNGTFHYGGLVISFTKKWHLSLWGFGYFIYQEMAPFIVGVWLFHLPRNGTFHCGGLVVSWLQNVPAKCRVYFRDRSASTVVIWFVGCLFTGPTTC